MYVCMCSVLWRARAFAAHDVYRDIITGLPYSLNCGKGARLDERSRGVAYRPIFLGDLLHKGWYRMSGTAITREEHHGRKNPVRAHHHNSYHHYHHAFT
jgi:hypothetical protein